MNAVSWGFPSEANNVFFTLLYSCWKKSMSKLAVSFPMNESASDCLARVINLFSNRFHYLSFIISHSLRHSTHFRHYCVVEYSNLPRQRAESMNLSHFRRSFFPTGPLNPFKIIKICWVILPTPQYHSHRLIWHVWSRRSTQFTEMNSDRRRWMKGVVEKQQWSRTMLFPGKYGNGILYGRIKHIYVICITNLSSSSSFPEMCRIRVEKINARKRWVDLWAINSTAKSMAIDVFSKICVRLIFRWNSTDFSATAHDIHLKRWCMLMWIRWYERNETSVNKYHTTPHNLYTFTGKLEDMRCYQ